MNSAGSLSVRLLSTIHTLKLPGSLAKLPSARKNLSISSLISNDTRLISPGASSTLLKAFSSFTGRTLLAATSLMYNWISCVPKVLPVFFTFTEAVSLSAADSLSAFRLTLPISNDV